MQKSIAFIVLFALAFAGCQNANAPTGEPLPDDGTSQYWPAAQKPFYHGVASGDPLSDRVVIWTRITPETAGEVEVAWQVATDPKMGEVVQSGNYTTSGERDYTVKIDVSGLEPATIYYFQFSALGAESPTGRTKTAPAGMTDQLNFAVVSCSNFEAGYFNAFGRIADMDELDAVLHLGDYIYEYEPGRYGDTTLGRLHLPPKEIVDLSDYRTRYSLYRLDPDFQRAHQQHPFITIWDDHEITNNAYQTGAQNHQPDEEGDYEQRKAAARQAYFEWLPVRETAKQTLYRRIDYGELVDLIMLDERLAGRSEQAANMDQPDYASEERSMLGASQLQWFFDQLSNSDATWKIIGNQVIFSDLDRSFARPNSPKNMDAWDGYPAEKKKIIDFLKNNDIENVVLVSGDTHCSWAMETPESIPAYQADSTATVAVEFGTTSISSANVDESVSVDTVLQMEKLYMAPANNPHLKFTNLRDHGYLVLRVTPEATRAEWRYMDDLTTRNDKEHVGKVLTVRAGTHELE